MKKISCFRKEGMLIFFLFLAIFLSGCISKGSGPEIKTIEICKNIPKTSSINNGDVYLDVTSVYHRQTDYNIGGRWFLELSYDYSYKSILGYKPDLTVTSGIEGTGSMLPTIGSSDTVIMEENPKNLKVGQIIMFKTTIYPRVTHRIADVGIDENGTFYLTKGDNNCNVDDWKIREQDIIGRVLGVIW